MLVFALIVAFAALSTTINGFSSVVPPRSLSRFVVSMVSPPPMTTLAQGLASLKASSTAAPSNAVAERPTTQPVSSAPRSHKSRPESKAELGFEPVRIFGKGHPGTAGKDLKVII